MSMSIFLSLLRLELFSILLILVRVTFFVILSEDIFSFIFSFSISMLLEVDTGIIEDKIEEEEVDDTLLDINFSSVFVLFDSVLMLSSSFKLKPKSIPKNINILINVLNLNNNSKINVLLLHIIYEVT